MSHPCAHLGCGREGCHGQGVYLRKGELGVWWRAEHVPPSFWTAKGQAAGEVVTERTERPPSPPMGLRQGRLL